MPRNARETRERILDAAHQAVLRNGFAGTSVDEIQEAAGISRGAFFYHFSSKEELARALIRRYDETDRRVAESLMARAERLATDPLQQALVFLGLYEELFQEMSAADAGCILASFSYEAGVVDAGAHSVMQENLDFWRTLFGGKLAQALERHGSAVPDLDPEFLTDELYAALQGAFLLQRSLAEVDQHVMVRHVRGFRRYLEILFGPVDAHAP